MFSYCLANPINSIDENGFDPIPIWAKHIITGVATEAEYKKALSVDANAWVGYAGYTVRRAILLAEEHQSHTVLAAEHHKRGTTNKSNKNKHENGQTRKQRDAFGEKGDARRIPNPNKRHSSSMNVDNRFLYGTIAIGATVGVVYLIANDATIIGAIDDALIAPLLPIIWDYSSKAFL